MRCCTELSPNSTWKRRASPEGRRLRSPQARCLSGWLLLALLLLGVAPGCRKGTTPAPPAEVPAPHSLSAAEVRELLPADLPDADGWARDLRAAFTAAGLPADLERVCGAVAILQQESGFQVDPPVPGLAEMVRARLDMLASSLGPPGKAALQALLAERKPGDTHTFAQRLHGLHTERDLDLLFRDMLAAAHAQHPVAYRAAALFDSVFRKARLEDFNPVGTAGSMQVSARWVLSHANGHYADADAVRDALFRRDGGLRWGVQRLWGYEAHYPRAVFRFADYNAGEYASRNAAVQRALSRLTGRPLAADGDLLAYDAHGEALGQESESLQALLQFALGQAGLGAADVRRDARLEKDASFENSPTYRALQRAYQVRFGMALPAAELPDVALSSPKLKGQYTTARYAHAVNAHFRTCLGRAEPPRP